MVTLPPLLLSAGQEFEQVTESVLFDVWGLSQGDQKAGGNFTVRGWTHPRASSRPRPAVGWDLSWAASQRTYMGSLCLA